MIHLTKPKYDLYDNRDTQDAFHHKTATLGAFEPKPQVITEFFDAYTIIEIEMEAVANRATRRKSKYSKSIDESDAERKEIVSAIRKGFLFYSTFDDAVTQEALQLIQPVFEKCFDEIHDKKKRSLSAAIMKFTAEVQNVPEEEALKTLRLDGKVADLIAVQTMLEELTNKRAMEDELDDTPQKTELIEKARHLDDGLEGVLFLKQLQGEGQFEELAHKLNGRIGDINTTAKARHTHKINEKVKLQEQEEEQLHDEDILLEEEEERREREERDLREELEEIHDEIHAEAQEELHHEHDADEEKVQMESGECPAPLSLCRGI